MPIIFTDIYNLIVLMQCTKSQWQLKFGTKRVQTFCKLVSSSVHATALAGLP